MNQTFTANCARLKPSLFYLPVGLLVLIIVFLYSQQALNVDSYRQIQKGAFFFLNSELAHYPVLIDNLTQIGDELIFFAFFSILIVYASETLGALIYALLVSAVFANVLKWLFAVPRPAATFDNDKFVIIGQALRGHNSFPSGHSITIFATLTILIFAFMPKATKYKILWCSFMIITGLIVASTRVGIGAHYPLDVLGGSIFGYISGLAGIFINRKYRIWTWMGNKKYYPFFILLLLVCGVIIVGKITGRHLVIYYLSLISLIISLYIIIKHYVGYIKK